MLDFNSLECNEFQRKAICHDKGPALVVAGPGSGKTFVITHRIQYLIQNLGVSSQNILVITFTKNAALEMKQRTVDLVGNFASGVSFGTFHSVFFNIICHAGGYTKGSVIDDKTKRNVILRLAEKYGITSNDREELIKNVQGDISRFKSNNVLGYEISCRSMSKELFQEVFLAYESYLSSHKLLDFDDLIIKTYEILKNNAHYRESWQKKFQYILIDEFQDIDSIQYEIIKMIIGEEKNIFVVGDDDQSIYGFRGSMPEIMLKFKNTFENAVIIELSVNYRSAREIVELAGLVIEDNEERYFKHIVAGRREEGIALIKEFKDRNSEAEYIKRFVLSHRGEEKEIALLFRTNRAARFYQEYLNSVNIPCKCKNYQVRIIEHFIVKDIFAYLNFAYGSHSRADYIRIMNKPDRGLMRDELPEVIDIDELINSSNVFSLDLESLWDMKNGFEHIRKLPLYGGINYILYRFDYLLYLKEYAKSAGIEYLDLEKIAMAIYKKARDFQGINEYYEFLKNAVYKDNKLLDINNSDDSLLNNDGVNIITMHGAKGLEFKYVIIPDAIEGVIPGKQSDTKDEIEEERRIFYVALTRAKDELHILYPKTYMGRAALISRFIENKK